MSKKNDPGPTESTGSMDDAALRLHGRRDQFDAAVEDLNRELLNEEQVSPDHFDQVRDEIEEIDRELEDLASKLTE